MEKTSYLSASYVSSLLSSSLLEKSRLTIYQDQNGKDCYMIRDLKKILPKEIFNVLVKE